ncbi:GNAT family N-acetyltransferase [Levilactobacillus tangyuanensis]|uniref:GNAT family N-acetyltransferase n=1 Tax=Levilactobacillus tangyuanensis TaxID=2486021 RepID=A0ABW1TN77_9LACO|nr:GNAT family N-acetyltransferase [Levilactobacillus tangyuanensis]
MDIRQVTLADLPDILRIENLGFTADEAGTEAQYRDRIAKLTTTFLVGKIADQVVGFVVGPATTEPLVEDWMYEATPANLVQGGNQLIFTIAVDPAYRGQHLGSQLLAAMTDLARSQQRETVALTSLARNVPFYEKNGFENRGVADSDHAGETWYNLVKTL